METMGFTEVYLGLDQEELEDQGALKSERLMIFLLWSFYSGVLEHP